ncbi:hypothetical protein LEP1GSC132_2841 [Leptospira kirschneri str. 200803703]|uniref:Uncharacterized protein n=1 Tax=Leptospira kirschneri str. 200802841 TaxID=1193047 RepID=A0A828Y6H2_9LEPT|nr:hypothetical protein LEP1GSC044_3691 [Leptospira kirschneri serovar Grippotyphosa str. RM52]EKO52033.1 hypothetical protein LEP1GSC131_3483 [Leptospira kirschneri str. 200802841]EKP05914.1 hypothetical protein LEP1GSC018_1627 [Leptospira kirschneri str. 2008720114]EKQ84549.1 hypothetical protein LEP1GSC064_1459 [Leptospira kirschneri serovar Grippotyphosa str. Moskva]EKR06692.1 hypothetical protein LEP1GSC122_1122 [Leptospira kirschneri serovar Valbuzzi str. 200702274]EMK05610.1 hypothetica
MDDFCTNSNSKTFIFFPKELKLTFTLFKVLRQVKNRTISHLKNIFEHYESFENQ